jgi:hypothetical protein
MKFIYKKPICKDMIFKNKILNMVLGPVCGFILSVNNKFKVNIKLNSYDTMNPNLLISTMSLELIKEYHKIKRISYPLIDNADIPKTLVTKNRPTLNSAEKWSYILCEIEYALQSHLDFEKGETDIDFDRMINGLRLFGKYYIHLKI